MDGKIVIREYEPADKEAVMELLRLNTPRYFAPGEAADLDAYLERERELYYVPVSYTHLTLPTMEAV